MVMAGRKFSAGSGYRYGFNGKEKDKDISSLTDYNYGFRIYSSVLGKFLSVDPLTKKYPELTGYQFSSNSPIANVDLDGKEAMYYRTVITFINHHKWVNGLGDVTYETQEINYDWTKPGLFQNGKLGSGDDYQISSIVKDQCEDANGLPDGDPTFSEYHLLKHIYKLSEADIMKEDISKRPMFDGKYQLMVFGYGDDNSESPGERPNPNATTETINMKTWDDIVEPLLVGRGFNPMDNETPTLEEIITDKVHEVISKAENKENKIKNAPDPNTTYCEAHKQNYLKNKDGNMSDELSDKPAGDTAKSHSDRPDSTRKTKTN